MRRIPITMLAGAVTLLLAISAAAAHPGGTDSSGCHTCRTNCSRWGLRTGQYHCHGSRGSSRAAPPPKATPPPPVRILRRNPLPSESGAPLPENSIVLPKNLATPAEPEVQVEVLAIVDGGTFVARREERLFLMTLEGVDAPDPGRPDGREARRRLDALIGGARITVRTGRVEDCVLSVRARTESGVEVAEELLAGGHALDHDGRP